MYLWNALAKVSKDRTSAICIMKNFAFNGKAIKLKFIFLSYLIRSSWTGLQLLPELLQI